MSRHHIEKVTCPSCHHEGDFEVWDSINTVSIYFPLYLPELWRDLPFKLPYTLSPDGRSYHD